MHKQFRSDKAPKLSAQY